MGFYLAVGGVVNGPELAMLGERGAREYVITTEAAYRDRSLSLFSALARDLGLPTYSAPASSNSTAYNINVTAQNAADIPAIRHAVDETLRTYVRTSTVLGRA